MKFPTKDLEAIFLTKTEARLLAYWRARPTATLSDAAHALDYSDCSSHVKEILTRLHRLGLIASKDMPEARKRRDATTPREKGEGFPPEFFAYVYYWRKYPKLLSIEIADVVGIDKEMARRFNKTAHAMGLIEDKALDRVLYRRRRYGVCRAARYRRCPLRTISGEILDQDDAHRLPLEPTKL